MPSECPVRDQRGACSDTRRASAAGAEGLDALGVADERYHDGDAAEEDVEGDRDVDRDCVERPAELADRPVEGLPHRRRQEAAAQLGGVPFEDPIHAIDRVAHARVDRVKPSPLVFPVREVVKQRDGVGGPPHAEEVVVVSAAAKSESRSASDPAAANAVRRSPRGMQRSASETTIVVSASSP